MRPTAELEGVRVKAFEGTTGILLGLDVDEDRRDGLLGFAIRRTDLLTGRKRYLPNLLAFPGEAHAPGEPRPSDKAPIQRFRWSDYATRIGRGYRYEVRPVYGAPGALKLGDGPTVEAATPGLLDGPHAVIFNRAAAASQAFSREFPDIERQLAEARADKVTPRLPAHALEWLTRGLLEAILEYIRQARAGWALDLAIYEYELPAIVEAVEAARGRGAEVRVVYHAKRNDDQTGHNEHALSGFPDEIKRGRKTSAIFHHKFIALSRIAADGTRTPDSVLCGSTNFTENGVYRQANVVHVVRDSAVAAKYVALFDLLYGGASVAETRNWIDAQVPARVDGPVSVGFSPRSGRVDLDLFARIIEGAQRDVVFATAFSLDPVIEEALKGEKNDPILRYGVQNRKDDDMTGIARDRCEDFVATARIGDGLEGWLKETTGGQRGSILLHCKLIIVDATTEEPTVISGSHNLSDAASGSNDENWLVLRDGCDVADRYTVEALRIYDHYRFRWHRQANPEKRAGASALATDGSWTDRYFGGDALRTTDRLAFSGGAVGHPVGGR